MTKPKWSRYQARRLAHLRRHDDGMTDALTCESAAWQPRRLALAAQPVAAVLRLLRFTVIGGDDSMPWTISIR